MKFLSYGAAGVLAATLLSTSALANGLGKTGSSGKSGSQPCTMCHNGGAAPTVELSGPKTLSAGAKGQYTLIIRGGAAVKGGMNVAVSNTTAALEAGTDLKKEGSELTHKAAKAFSNGELRFDFSMTAPSAAGTVTLFGAGNSANGNGDITGDQSATTTLDVTVTAPGGTNPEPEEPAGGCSSTGGAPALMFVLAAAGVTLLRRRHG